MGDSTGSKEFHQAKNEVAELDLKKKEKKEIFSLIKSILIEGLVYVRKVGKVGQKAKPLAGYVYLPKGLIGKTCRIIVIPLDEMDLSDLVRRKKDSYVSDSYVKNLERENDLLKDKVRELEMKEIHKTKPNWIPESGHPSRTNF